jgi:hypothetical protein
VPTTTYYLDAAKTEAIILKWGLFWKNFTISKDGEIIAQMTGRKALKDGATLALADGRVLEVQLRRQFSQEELVVLLDGQPLPGSSTDPHYRLQQAFYTLLVIGGLNIVLGLVADIGTVELLQKVGMGYGTVFFGLVYFGLAWWARAKNAALPLYIAIGILVVDVVLSFVMMGEGTSPSTPGLFLRFYLIMVLYKGAIGAKQIRNEETVASVSLI